MASTDLLSYAICVPNRQPFSPHIFFQTNRWHILLQPLDWTCMHHEVCCSKWSALYIIRVELVMYISAICHLYVWVVPLIFLCIYKCFRAHSVPIFLGKNVRTRTVGIPFWWRLVFWSSVCRPSDGIFGSLRKYWTEICHRHRWGFYAIYLWLCIYIYMYIYIYVYIYTWLVVWNMFIFRDLLGIIIPTDEYFQRGGSTTNQIQLQNWVVSWG